MQDLKDRLETFYELCRQNRLKITPQRIEVYKALAESSEHPSAEAVYTKVKQVLPNVSLDTVNRTLNTLSEIGAAFVVEGSGDVKRFDGNLENHQHIKYVKCKKIFDFQYDKANSINIPEQLAGGFKILRATVYIEGLCQKCLEKENENQSN